MSEFEKKVLDLLENINKKLDDVMGSIKAGAAPAPALSSVSSAPAGRKPSELVEQQKEEAKLIEKPPVEGRRICPDCGGTTFNAVEDRSNVLHQMGGMKIYAKNYVCKGCGKVM